MRKIFTERIPAIAAPYAHSTTRMSDLHRAVAFVAGGEPGARLAKRLGMPISPDTLLRRIRATPLPAATAARVLGVDDFALRRGRRYGTLLVDLERHRVIDLLEDRSAESFAAWLTAHPGTEILSRDRGECYAEGGRTGAPSAQHVADRFHLMKNSGDALERFLATHRAQIQAAATAATAELRETAVAASATPPDPCPEHGEPAELAIAERPPNQAERERAERRARRLTRYERVIELWQGGSSRRAIARETRLNRATVNRYIKGGAFPEISPHRARRSGLDPFVQHLQRRWAEGCRNAVLLYVELCELGYSGSIRAVRGHVCKWRDRDGRTRAERRAKPGPPPIDPVKVPSPRRAMWLLIGDEEQLDARSLLLRKHLLAVDACFGGVTRLVLEFRTIVRTRSLDAFAEWLSRAKASGAVEVVNFAKGLEQDRSAVEAALRLEWSNGQLEGQISKLKTLKRAMYGRAKPDLLKARMLHGP